jgi:hypothetical protein
MPPPPGYDDDVVSIPSAYIQDAPDIDSVPMAPAAGVPMAPEVEPPPAYDAGAPKSLGDVLRAEGRHASQRKKELNVIQKPDEKGPAMFDQSELQKAVLARREKLKNVPKVEKKVDKEQKSELQNTIAQGIASLRKVERRRNSMGAQKGSKSEMDVDKYREMGGARPKWKPKAKMDMKDVDMTPFSFRCERCRDVISNMDMIDTQNGYFHTECFLCSACNKGLLGEYLTCNEVFFHPECLNCSVCKQSLIEQPMMCTNEYKLFCSQDAPRDLCAGCSQRCESGRVLQIDDRIWHEACFVCVECRQSLSGKNFVTHNNRYYCKADYESRFAVRCTRCSKETKGQCFKIKAPLDGSEMIFHESCYSCAQCKTRLKGKGSYPLDGDVYCKAHYDENKPQQV